MQSKDSTRTTTDNCLFLKELCTFFIIELFIVFPLLLAIMFYTSEKYSGITKMMCSC